MKKIVFVALAMLVGFAPTLAQTTQSVAQQIRKFYNKQQPDSIYALTDTTFKKALKRETFAQVSHSQLFPYGQITSLQFLETNSNGVDRYKLLTDKSAVLEMQVKTNQTGEINTLFFKPWKERLTVNRSTMWHDNALKNELDSTVHSITQKYFKENATPGMSILVMNGTKANFYNYGIARKTTEQHPTPKTLYEIGSISKTFTAFLLADAVTKKLVKLTDPIVSFLPDSVKANKALHRITLVQLSNHTSGLPRLPANLLEGSTLFTDPYAAYGNAQLFKFLKTAKPETKPGTRYAYSNLAVGLLGVILETVYNKPLENLYQEIIFKPFKMKYTHSTSVTDTTSTAAPYNEQGSPERYWNFKSLSAAGSLKSNTEDLAWYALQFNMRPRNAKRMVDPRILLLDTVTYTDETVKVGLGWHFGKTKTGAVIKEHSGGTGGFRSYMGLCEEKKLAVVILINNTSEFTGQMAGEIWRYLVK